MGYAARSGGTPRDPYAEVTDRIVALLEAGTPPWRRPWDQGMAAACPTSPRNAVTGAPYRGVNVLVLGMSPHAFLSGDPRWATYRQAQERGWQVRKGERGTTAYFFKRLEVRDSGHGRRDDGRGDGRGGQDSSDDGVRRIPLLRSFTLFNAAQLQGIGPYLPPSLAEAPWRAPEAVELVVANSRAELRYGGSRAFYSPATDHIQMPPRGSFATAGGFAGTVVHELGHWSGAATRLARDLTGRFGSQAYAREEARAEIATCMVCAELGVEGVGFENSAAYLAGWLEVLRGDRREVFRAAADAQRIADYLLAYHPDWAARTGRAGSAAAAGGGEDGDPGADLAGEGAGLREAA